ncbi:hypothetical protein K469DRAFT_560321 [Zopfia rhizophila CBS 207.26]|uniref:Uncharacterized protein n=1 Tax=Zopfia rhizophila CBS 207.26 TaxID=1314779 RepID=A0A6A6EDQ4_9PEZI|nr:hypothetical protein K469DRAFT_560321 [Zopfia rhizophila CBS 207.26]
MLRETESRQITQPLNIVQKQFESQYGQEDNSSRSDTSGRQIDPDGGPRDLHADTTVLDWLQASNEDSTKREPDSDVLSLEPHLFNNHKKSENEDWKNIRAQLPESWMWDVDYHSIQSEHRGYWTCTPTDPDNPENFPLTIAGDPVIIPVEYHWPPMAGVNPPPDPRPSTPISPTAGLSMDMVRDLFLTFKGSIGFYVLLNGLLQIIVSEEFDTEWASSHLPHKYGGLRVCYIPQSTSPTMLPTKTETMKSKGSQGSAASSIFGQFRPQSTTLFQTHHLNDFIEVRTKSSHRKEKFAGRIGLKTSKQGDEFVVMSTHVITEAILAKSQRSSIFGRKRSPFDQLDSDWNEHVEIWAGNETIGLIGKTFDPDAAGYPDGFMHDITLIKPTNPSVFRDIQTPVSDLGWISREGWNSLRQQSNTVKILGDTESHRAAKSLKTNRPSEVLVVGEGIFLNQNASIKPTKEHDIRTWKDLVSRCLLYRVYPDFDPPNGYSGVALYTDGLREDGSVGPGVVGFQSFVQRSGHVQNFEMEGEALEKRLKLGRVAFYGAFQVPEELRKEHAII